MALAKKRCCAQSGRHKSVVSSRESQKSTPTSHVTTLGTLDALVGSPSSGRNVVKLLVLESFPGAGGSNTLPPTVGAKKELNEPGKSYSKAAQWPIGR